LIPGGEERACIELNVSSKYAWAIIGMCWIINIRIPNIPWLKMPIGAKRLAAHVPDI
jgi:hypothetical protein